MGRHDFLDCIFDCTTFLERRFPSWPLIERGCENPTWLALRDQWDCTKYHLRMIYFDFTKYHLWMIYFLSWKFVNGCIISRGWDLTKYHLWKRYFWMFSMLIGHCYTQRAQPTLRLHSSRFVVESCDVFVGNRTLFEVFGNISTVWEPNLFGISSRLESSLLFAQNHSLVFVTFEQYLNWIPNDTRWLKPEREKQSVCWSVACCLEWFEREHESLTRICGKAFG